MDTGGRNTFKGVNAQALAAMSLLLQYYPYVDLEAIQFEQEKLKDFNVLFTTGKKIICESKAYKLTYSDIRTILDDIGEINDRDEIIIICEGVSKDVKQDIEYYKYFEEVKNKLIKKKFTHKHFDLFPHLRFWEVNAERNEKTVLDLLTEALGMWVSDDSLQEIADSLLVRKIYHGSEKGKTLTSVKYPKF